MKKNSALRNFLTIAIFFILISLFFLSKQTIYLQKVQASSPIQHVFIIMMENHNWNQIKGSASAPYINKTLLPMGGHAEQYYNPPGMHPSEPNYIWLEAGTNFGILNDNNPSSNNISSTNHLVTLLKNKGLSWKAYQEDIPGTNCPINNTGNYAVRHAPFVFFNDVSGKPPSTSNSYCQSHYIPFTKLSADLTSNSIADYNFITPDECHDMHSNSCNAFGTSDLVKQGDTWLSQEVPMILNSQAYKSNGLLIITWDEGEGGDGPIGMIVLSPLAKKNYTNTIHYDHSSTLKTMEEIFGVSPMLGGAAKATDLSDFFTGSITSGGSGNTPTPSEITPTLFCLGSCNISPSPSAGVSQNPSVSPSTTSGSPTPSTSVTPGPKPCKSDNDKDNDSKSKGKCNSHHTKGHHHRKGAISNTLLQLLQFLIALLNKLFGMNIPPIGVPGQVTPTPTATDSATLTPEVSITPETSASQSGESTRNPLPSATINTTPGE